MRLAELRKHAGLTQKELAEKAGISLHTYRNWEQGHRRGPSAKFLIALARVLNTTPEVLLNSRPT